MNTQGVILVRLKSDLMIILLVLLLFLPYHLTPCLLCIPLEEERAELARFAKNYLPILFNLYTADPVEGEPLRAPLLDCIRAYLSITETKVCC